MTNQNDAALVAAELHATWGLLVDRGWLTPQDVQTLKLSARQRARHNVHAGHDIAIGDIVDCGLVRMRSARRRR
jgi:hypothetical protein